MKLSNLRQDCHIMEDNFSSFDPHIWHDLLFCVCHYTYHRCEMGEVLERMLFCFAITAGLLRSERHVITLVR